MIFFFSVVAPYDLHVLLCFDQFFHPSEKVKNSSPKSLLVYCRPTVGRQYTNSLPTVLHFFPSLSFCACGLPACKISWCGFIPHHMQGKITECWSAEIGGIFLKNKGTFNLVMFILTFGAAFRKGFITRQRVQMQFPQKFCPLLDKQAIASALWKLGINFTRSFKVFFPKIARVAKANCMIWLCGQVDESGQQTQP